ncbi:MAG: YhhN family, partial [Gemmatimonadetes bacterium]|nr:YhhN family [Gemmatimonadota bacterium]
LALDRFRSPVPMSPLLVLGTYYAAQMLIASSVGVARRS